MRGVCVMAGLLLAACGGGSDGPTPPVAPTGPTAVRVTSVVVTGVLSDQLTLPVRNAGGAGQYRIQTHDVVSPGQSLDPQGRPIGPRVVSPRLRCQSTALLINAGVSSTQTLTCASGAIAWITVDVQDGSSPTWVRTACAVSNTITTPEEGVVCTSGALKPER